MCIRDRHIIDAMPDCPSVKKLVSVGPDIPEGFEDFHKGIEKADTVTFQLTSRALPFLYLPCGSPLLILTTKRNTLS